jgi:hypothetical protein
MCEICAAATAPGVSLVTGLAEAGFLAWRFGMRSDGGAHVVTYPCPIARKRDRYGLEAWMDMFDRRERRNLFKAIQHHGRGHSFHESMKKRLLSGVLEIQNEHAFLQVSIHARSDMRKPLLDESDHT